MLLSIGTSYTTDMWELRQS